MKHTLYIGALLLALAVTACGQIGPLVAPKARNDGQPPASEDAPPGNETSQDSELTADPDFSSEESDD